MKCNCITIHKDCELICDYCQAKQENINNWTEKDRERSWKLWVKLSKEISKKDIDK